MGEAGSGSEVEGRGGILALTKKKAALVFGLAFGGPVVVVTVVLAGALVAARVNFRHFRYGIWRALTLQLGPGNGFD